MESKKSEAGFTYMSLLFSLVIIVISLPILTYSFKQIAIIPYNESLAIQQFFFIVQTEVYVAKEIYTNNNCLYLVMNDDETVELNYYLQQIRRQVNGRGHEVYLRNIEALRIDPLDYGVMMTVVTTKGEQYERIIVDHS